MRLAALALVLVGFGVRRPRLTLALTLSAGLLALALVIARFSLSTDVIRLFPEELPWRQTEERIREAFPDRAEFLVVVLDATTPDRADRAAATLSDRLAAQPALFRVVLRPDGDPFFRRHALLFLPLAEVAAATERIVAAQPLLGTLAADPSLRGVARVLELLARAPPDAALAPALGALTRAATAAAAGEVDPIDWTALFSGRPPDPRALRRFVLLAAIADFDALAPLAGPIAAVREAARDLEGVRVRLTGERAIEDEEFSTVFGGAVTENLLSLLSVALLLWLGLRSARLILPILLVLVLGLVLTTAFGVVAVGPYNPLSIAFAVLFIGLGVDFGIQYAVALREQRHRQSTLPLAGAQRAAAVAGGPGVLLAAAALAAGFLAFWPTDYRGVSELGLIAAAGMGIAALISLTTLPALLQFSRPRPEPEEVGYAWLGPLDRWLTTRARTAALIALAVGVAALALLPWLRFDTNPLNLRDPNTEAVSTFRELLRDPEATPNAVQALAAGPDAAAALTARLAAVPEVGGVRSLASFVPEEQAAKLALVADASALVGPTLEPPPSPPTDPAAIRTALRGAAAAWASRAPELRDALGRVASDPVAQGRLEAALLPGLTFTLAGVRDALAAGPVTLATLPDALRRDWVTADGRWRLEVTPRDRSDTAAAQRRFARAVQTVAPEASGPAISITESAATIEAAFLRAGAIAAVLTVALLLAALRSLRLAIAALAPLALAGVLTLATCVLIGQPLNLANIVALPLLFAQGVAFDIYYVAAWAAGQRRLLPAALTRAMLFSALTNGTAFGTLALSPHPGTASLGLLLTLSLLWALATVVLTLPPILCLLAPDARGRP